MKIYFPQIIQKSDFNKLCDNKNLTYKCEKYELLLSEEGTFESKNNKLYKLNFIDKPYKYLKIKNSDNNFLLDESIIERNEYNKLPFNFDENYIEKYTFSLSEEDTSPLKLIIENIGNNMYDIYCHIDDKKKSLFSLEDLSKFYSLVHKNNK